MGPLQDQTIPIPLTSGIDTKTDEKLVPLPRLITLENTVRATGKTRRKRDGFSALTTTGLSGTTARGAIALDDTVLQVIDKTAFDLSSAGWKSKTLSAFTESRTQSAPLTIKEIIGGASGKCDPDYITLNGSDVYAWISDGGASYMEIDATTGDVIVGEAVLSSAGSTKLRLYPMGTTDVWMAFDEGSNFKVYKYSTSTHTLSGPYTIASDLGNAGASTGYAAFEIIPYDSGAAAFVYVTTTNTNAKMGYLKTDGTLGNGGNGYPAVATIADANIYTGPCLGLVKEPSNGKLWFYYWRNTQVLMGTARVGATLVNSVSPFVVFTSTGTTKFGHIGVIWESGNNMAVVWDRDGSSAAGIDQVASSENYGNHSWNATSDFPKVRTTEFAQIDNTGSVDTVQAVAFRCNMATMPFYFGSNLYVWLIYNGTAVQDSGYTSQNTYFLVKISKYSERSTVVAKAFAGTAAQKASQQSQSIIHGNVPNIQSSGNTYFAPFLVLTDISQSPFRFLSSLYASSVTLYARPIAGAQVNKITVDLSYTQKISFRKTTESVLMGPNILKQYDGKQINELGFPIAPEALFIDWSTAVVTVTQQGTGVLPEKTTVRLPAAWRISAGDFWLQNAVAGARTIRFNARAFETQNLNITIGPYDDANTVAATANTAINGAGLGFTSTVAGDTLTITNTANGAVTDASATQLATTYNVVGGSNGLSDGTYSYVAVYEWVDAKGNLHRSAPSFPKQVVLSGGGSAQTATVFVQNPNFCDKLLGFGNVYKDVVIQLYRTLNNGTIYFRATRTEFPVYGDYVNGSNAAEAEWIPVLDVLGDSNISSNNILYTAGGVLENIAPPQLDCFHVAKDRGWLIPTETPNTAWFSKARTDGEGMAFSDVLTLPIEPVSGGVKAIGSIDETVSFFQRRSCLFTSGEGPDDEGNGSFFTPEILSKDLGCSDPDSIINIPKGLIFKSNKGWYLLDRSMSLSYIGADVEAYLSLTVKGATAIYNSHQILFVHSDGSALQYDYAYEEWSVWTNLLAVDAFTYQDKFCILRSDGTVWQQTPGTYKDPSNTQIVMKLKTAWIQLAGLAGFQRVRKAEWTGLFPVNYNINVNAYYDFSSSPTALSSFSAAGDKQFRCHLPIQKCEALQLEIYDTATGSDFSSVELTGLTLDIAAKRGINKLAAAKSVG